jgi:hypothetical protein
MMRQRYVQNLMQVAGPIVMRNKRVLFDRNNGQAALRQILRMVNSSFPQAQPHIVVAFINDLVLQMPPTITVQSSPMGMGQIISNSNQGLVTSAINPGSVTSTGVNGLISSGITAGLNALGITGAAATGLTTVLGTVIRPAITNALGTGMLVNSGVSGVIASTVTPALTQLINQSLQLPIAIPESAIEGALTFGIDQVLSPVFSAIR